MSYYIYKYVYNGTVIYIGQTINLVQRINQHKNDKLRNFNGEIYYFECPNKTAMNSWEYFLINKYHPIFNEALKDDKVNISIEEPNWIIYNEQNKIIDFLIKKEYIKSKIISNPKPQEKRKVLRRNIKFYCNHCHTKFVTDNWSRTKKGHYSASCPNCPYTGWAR